MPHFVRKGNGAILAVLGTLATIRKKDYAFSRQGIVVLSDELKRKYIELLSSILDRKRDYKARVGIRRSDGYQRMEEITIMKMRCAELRDFITGVKRLAHLFSQGLHFISTDEPA
jgi:hypothetical protein